MRQFLSVYYFTFLILHVSATVCHLQGARLYLQELHANLGLVDKILRSVWLCVCYVSAWCVSICRSVNGNNANSVLQPVLTL
jgi:hypothetical protein